MFLTGFTLKSQEAIQESLAKAQKLGQQQIESEHLTLSLLEQTDGLISEVVQALGIKLDLLIKELNNYINNLPTHQKATGVNPWMNGFRCGVTLYGTP